MPSISEAKTNVETTITHLLARCAPLVRKGAKSQDPDTLAAVLEAFTAMDRTYEVFKKTVKDHIKGLVKRLGDPITEDTSDAIALGPVVVSIKSRQVLSVGSIREKLSADEAETLIADLTERGAISTSTYEEVRVRVSLKTG